MEISQVPKVQFGPVNLGSQTQTLISLQISFSPQEGSQIALKKIFLNELKNFWFIFYENKK